MKPSALLLLLLPSLACAEDPTPPALPEPPRQEQEEISELTEDDFVRLMKEPKTVILDARVKESFDAMHVKGALHLPLRDFNAAAVEKLIPDKTTRILIYCDENFRRPPRPDSFGTQHHQDVAVTIGLQMHNRLKTYGYTKVRELHLVINTEKAKIPLEGTAISKWRAALRLCPCRVYE